MRTHIVVPEELIEEVDRLVGKRKRSQFIEEAIRIKVKREKLGQAIKAAAGSLRPEDYPEWSSPEKVTEWLRAMRREADQKLEEKIARWNQLAEREHGKVSS